MTDRLKIYGQSFNSRLLMGSALFPSVQSMQAALEAGQPAMVTLSLRRQTKEGGQAFWEHIKALNLPLLPNTAGCKSVIEAVTLAEMSRELFATPWIKLELIGDEYSLYPDVVALVEAADILIKQGFNVLPYCTDDPVVCQRLIDIGCEALMPLGAPIGTGQGLLNPFNLKMLRARFPETVLIVDAGLGLPSHATQAMELGCDAVLLNSAIAQAADPTQMALAFNHAVTAGRLGYLSQPMLPQERAAPSTPTLGMPVWHQTQWTPLHEASNLKEDGR